MSRGKAQAKRTRAQSEEKPEVSQKQSKLEALTEREQDILFRHQTKAEKCKERGEPIPDYVREVIEHYGGKLP